MQEDTIDESCQEKIFTSLTMEGGQSIVTEELQYEISCIRCTSIQYLSPEQRTFASSSAHLLIHVQVSPGTSLRMDLQHRMTPKVGLHSGCDVRLPCSYLTGSLQ